MKLIILIFIQTILEVLSTKKFYFKNLSNISNSLISNKFVANQNFPLSTPPNDDGAGSVFYLDRHNVKCPDGQALQAFHLTRPSDNKILYKFNCLKDDGIDQKEVEKKQTDFNDSDKNDKSSTNYLDRHEVKCPQGKAIQQFHLIRNPQSTSKIAYEYTCVKIIGENCKNLETDWSDGDGGDSIRTTHYLDRQTINLGGHSVLTSFKLVTKYQGSRASYKYAFGVCDLKTTMPTLSATNEVVANQNLPMKTPANDDGAGSVFYLDRHNVKCPDGQALQAFHFTRPSGNQIMYEFNCLKDEGIDQKEVEKKQTNFNDSDPNDKSSTNYLDRHEVKCPQGKAIQQFHLIRNPQSASKIAYEYTCIKIHFDNCQKRETKWTHGDAEDSIKLNYYLDRQLVKVEGKNVLTSFKLITKYEGGNKRASYKYDYEYCLVTAADAKTAPTPNEVVANQNLPMKTPANEDGAGSVFYLDRHNVKCPDGQALQAFHLTRPSDNKILYEFNCLKDDGIYQKEVEKKQTNFNDSDPNDKSSTNYLDRHEVKCPQGKAIQQFHLIRNPQSTSKIAYEYTCVKINVDKCEKGETKWTHGDGDDSIKSTHYLDRQLVKAEGKNVLISFKLSTKYEGANSRASYKYDYEFCSVKVPDAKTSADTNELVGNQKFSLRTPANDDGAGSVFYLDRHNVKCPDGQALQAFHFTRPSDNKILYEFECLKDDGIDQKEVDKKQTDFNDSDKNDKSSTNYLDRHEVKCPQGKAIQQFHLIRNPQSTSKIAYEYTCVKINVDKCEKGETKWTHGDGDDSIKATHYLDRQIVKAEGKNVLISFKLSTKYEGASSRASYKYDYEYCSVKGSEFHNVETPKGVIPNQNFPRKTPANDDGAGSVFYLDRHNVKCPDGQAIRAFHLTRPSKNQIMYEYACFNYEGIDQKEVEKKQTDFNDSDKNDKSSTNYLDRHEVKCPQGKAIQQFHLIRNPQATSKIAYEYTCVKINVDKCEKGETDWTNGDAEDSMKTTHYLDRQMVKLDEKDVLKSFKLKTKYEGKNNRSSYKYVYEYCSMKSITPPNIPIAPTNTTELPHKKVKKFKDTDYLGGSLIALTHLHVHCSKGKALRRFRIRVKNDKIQYRFFCHKSHSISDDPSLVRRFQTPYTNLTEKSGISAYDLQHHCVICPEKYAIQKFFLKLDPKDETRISYEYDCVPVESSKLTGLNTAWSLAHNKETRELIDHRIRLEKNQVLRTFKLNVIKETDKTKYSYHVDFYTTDT